MEEKDKDKIFDLILEKAPDPTDIIWENLFITDQQRRYRKIGMKFAVFVVMILAFYIMCVLTGLSVGLSSVVDSHNCTSTSLQYG